MVEDDWQSLHANCAWLNAAVTFLLYWIPCWIIYLVQTSLPTNYTQYALLLLQIEEIWKLVGKIMGIFATYLAMHFVYGLIFLCGKKNKILVWLSPLQVDRQTAELFFRFTGWLISLFRNPDWYERYSRFANHMRSDKKTSASVVCCKTRKIKDNDTQLVRWTIWFLLNSLFSDFNEVF